MPEYKMKNQPNDKTAFEMGWKLAAERFTFRDTIFAMAYARTHLAKHHTVDYRWGFEARLNYMVGNESHGTQYARKINLI